MQKTEMHLYRYDILKKENQQIVGAVSIVSDDKKKQYLSSIKGKRIKNSSIRGFYILGGDVYYQSSHVMP